MLAVGGGADPQISPFLGTVLFVTSLRECDQPGVALLPGPETGHRSEGSGLPKAA